MPGAEGSTPAPGDAAAAPVVAAVACAVAGTKPAGTGGMVAAVRNSRDDEARHLPRPAPCTACEQPYPCAEATTGLFGDVTGSPIDDAGAGQPYCRGCQAACAGFEIYPTYGCGTDTSSGSSPGAGSSSGVIGDAASIPDGDASGTGGG